MDLQVRIGGGIIRAVRLTAYGALCLLLIAAILFSGFYIFSGYQHLIAWYNSMGSCFYRSSYWAQDFFTAKVKSQGNLYCALATLLSLTGIYFTTGKMRQAMKGKSAPLQVSVSPLSVAFYIALAAFCSIMWHTGSVSANPAYDEVFSALNVAGIHPFLGASYYMLPNNHLLFNLLNNILSRAFADAIASGRLLSLACYIAFAWAAFTGLKNLIQNRWVAFMLTVAMASQFFVWGFSFQARGYELYLLCECGLFISLFAYLSGRSNRWLSLHSVCIALGYFCMPSFLYFHAGLVVFIAAYQLLYRQWQLNAWIAQAKGMVLTFLLYLPTLCFSGYNAIGNNHYVAPMARYKDSFAFCQWMFPYFKPYTTHIFSGIAWHGFSFDILLCLLPLLLLLSGRKSKYFLLGLFYAVLVLVFFALVIAMKRLSFERNLIGHYSIALAFLLITVHWLTTLARPAPPAVRGTASILVAMLLIVQFFKTNNTLLRDTLYEYDVNAAYMKAAYELNNLLPTGTIAYSDESFYCRYILEKRFLATNKCADGTGTFYVKQPWEPLPLPYQHYKCIFKEGAGEVYASPK